MNLRKLLRRYPLLRKPARALYRQGQYLLAWTLGKARQDPLALLFIDPQKILNTVAVGDPSLTGNQLWHLGSVSDGDWDLGGVQVQEHDGVYAILEKHIVDGVPFKDIQAFQSNLNKIQNGELIDSSATEAEYFNRWLAIENLYNKIAAEGYKSQAELGNDNPVDEVRVQISRQGAFLFEEGLHRLVIAQILQIPLIPVLVTRRHAQWSELRQAVLKIVLQRGFVHQPFDHPDLDSLNEIYGNELAETAVYGRDRWQFIQNNLPFNQGTVLDIGAYFGYFCHRLEEIGFDCLAVEPDPQNLRVLKSWQKIKQRKFAIFEGSIFDLQAKDYDIVLALNIFHHLVRSEEGYNQLKSFLGQLNCKAMFFEPDDNAGYEAYCHYDDAAFIQFVLDNSCLQSVNHLGKAQEGRNVYLLTI